MHRLDATRRVIDADMALIHDSLLDRLDTLQGKTLLLTGAAGMLPAYIAETVGWLNRHRFSRDCHLIALVRSPISEGSRLAHLMGRPDVTFLVQDVRDPIDIAGRVDFVIHAASRASPRSYLEDPLDAIDANTSATRRLLELAREKRCESVLFFSSAEIYGEVPADRVPTPESYAGNLDCTSPRAIYAESKRFGETLCATYWRQFGVRVKMVRPFHVCGPGMRLGDGRVVADFLRDRVESRPIRVLGGGSALRTFCYLADATIGFFQALLSNHDGESFNIGDDREVVSIRELAEVVAGLDSPRLEVMIATDSPPDHLKGSPSRAYPDLTKARMLLGYRPETTLREGLSRTLRSLAGALR